jgi:1,4-alpha-glucan branching enzyme
MSRYKKNVGAFVQSSGVSFRVWAPFADSVAIVGTFSNGEIAMDSEGDGYWHKVVKHAEPGQEYKYLIRNGDKTLLRNDPRAQHLTTSTGYSVIVGDEFDWEGDDFQAPAVEQQVIYELHIGTFNRPDSATMGTFEDAIEKLPHLAELGINMIEVMPINTMLDDRGWGYATDYIFAVESLYGGRHGFMELVKAAHKLGIGVIVDVVYNHFGPDDRLDLWQFDGWSENGKGGIYFYNDWRGDTPWGARPDYGRAEVRQYLLDNVRMWLSDCHVDGLRVDSTIYLRNVHGVNNDPSGDLSEAWFFLQELNEVALKTKPNALMIAEDVADNEFITKPSSEGGANFRVQWELGFAHALRTALHSSNNNEIDLGPISYQLSRRFNGDPFQRVGYVDSHDSAANGGARFNEDIAPAHATELFARKRQLVAAGIALTAPMIPMMLQGQEFMEDQAFNDWRGLDWDKAQMFSGIIEAHKHLIALRKNTTGVSAGLMGANINISHVDQANKVIVYHRWANGGPHDDVIVVANCGVNSFEEYSFGFPRNGTWRVRFNSNWRGYSDDFEGIEVHDFVVKDGSGTIVLPPASLIILSQDA